MQPATRVTPKLTVPNTTETKAEYARRQLYSLAHILGHLSTEQWDSPEERTALLQALDTWPNVLYKIANHIEDVGFGEE